MECVSVTIAANTIRHESISLILVGDPLLILVVALEPNCLFVGTQVLSQMNRPLADLDHVLESGMDFPVWMCISWRCLNQWVDAGKERFEMLMSLDGSGTLPAKHPMDQVISIHRIVDLQFELHLYLW